MPAKKHQYALGPISNDAAVKINHSFASNVINGTHPFDNYYVVVYDGKDKIAAEHASGKLVYKGEMVMVRSVEDRRRLELVEVTSIEHSMADGDVRVKNATHSWRVDSFGVIR